jgi:hypothetical protein
MHVIIFHCCTLQRRFIVGPQMCMEGNFRRIASYLGVVPSIAALLLKKLYGDCKCANYYCQYYYCYYYYCSEPE